MARQNHPRLRRAIREMELFAPTIIPFRAYVTGLLHETNNDDGDVRTQSKPTGTIRSD